MTGISDLLAAIAATLVAAGGLLALRGRLRHDRGLRGELVAYFGGATLAALVCAVMNVLEFTGGGTTAAAVGNATNVLAPAVLWSGARRLNGRESVGTVVAVAVALLVFGVTYVVPLDAATLLKTAAIAGFAVVGAAELRRAALRKLPGTRTMAVALWLFAAFNAGRIVLALTVGMTSWAWGTFASAEVTSFVSAAAILVVTVGAIRLGRHLLDDPEPGTRTHARLRFREEADELLSEHPSITALRLHLPELDLIRVAHGSERADATVAALVDAARDGLPGAAAGILTRDTVGAVVADPGTDILAALRESFAARAAGCGIDDVPELRLSRTTISDRAGLEEFFDSASRRR